MTPYEMKHLMFLLSFLVMLVDGTVSPSEIEFNKTFYEKEKQQNAPDFHLVSNELNRQVNLNGSAIYAEYFNQLKDLSLPETEKVQLLEIALRAAESDRKVTESEKELLLQLKTELDISQTAFSRTTCTHFQKNATRSKSFSDFVESLDLPELDVRE